MLDPHERTLLLASLRPPAGWRLDRAIATTFTLDLLALLTTPLAFTLFDAEDRDGRPRLDPMALLEACRRFADRIVVFCQAAQIAVPRKQQLLYGFLEDSIIEVVPRRGLFHPKIWLLRFVADDEPVRYRLLVLSRNLTFDRSWDTAVVLDGQVADRTNAIGDNHPLGDFVRELPKLARRVSRDLAAEIEGIEHEIRRVRWDLPPGFDQVRFCPLGLDGHRDWPIAGRIDRLLVVSPFLTGGALTRLGALGRGNVLISRLESVSEMEPRSLAGFERVYALDESASALDDEVEDLAATFRGLHAKLYIAEAGWDATVWTGSANATDAAFGDNVELLVGLIGKRSKVGIDQMLGDDTSRTTFLELLQPFTPSGPAQKDQDPDAEALELARKAVASASILARARALDEQRCRVELVVAGGVESWEQRIHVACWPITLRSGSRTFELNANPAAAFDLATDSLTSFFAFELTLPSSPGTRPVAFVLNIPLEGAPSNRRERLLRALLTDREQVLRFLLFLLAGDAAEAIAALGAQTHEAAGPAASAPLPFTPLFETMVRALDRDPSKLDDVERVVRDLRASPESEALLPEGFLAVWNPIWQTRQGSRT